MAVKSKTRAYYELDSRLTSRGPGWEIANIETLQPDKAGLGAKAGWPDGLFVLPRGPWTLPEYLEPPHFIFDRKLGHDPRDIESIDGFFFISPKMKAVFEELAPEGCDFRPCTTQYRNGGPGPELWLCSVTQAFRDAIDKEGSTVRFKSTGGYMFSGGGVDLKFRADVIGGAHVFRLAETASRVFCDEDFKARCKAVGIRGISFAKVGMCTEYSSQLNRSLDLSHTATIEIAVEQLRGELRE
jgi:hypothetical protein